LIIRRLIALLAMAFVALYAGRAAAQGAAPLLGGGLGEPPRSGASDVCRKDFAPLREEAEKRGRLIKAASDRKAPADETCKLIAAFGEAEIKMIKYVDLNAAVCGIPQRVSDQLKAGHKNTEALQQKVCSVAQMQRRWPNSTVRINDSGDRAIALDLLGRPLVGDFGHLIRQIP